MPIVVGDTVKIKGWRDPANGHMAFTGKVIWIGDYEGERMARVESFDGSRLFAVRLLRKAKTK